ncbi:MAG: hypothetical protein MJ060_04190 [Clostridia bacterium]|nr:hypothetical protein [Clostridia bacterium]
MIELYDLVRYKKDGKLYFVIDIDTDGGTKPPIYGLELENQYAEDWHRWAEEDEIEFVSKTGSHIKD